MLTNMTMHGKKLLSGCLITLFLGNILLGNSQLPQRKIVFSNLEHVVPNSLAVVVEPNSNNIVKFAAKELANFLSLRLGYKVPIVDKVSTSNKRFIVLGLNQLASKANITKKMFVRDSFVIKTKANLIFIAGIDDLNKDPAKTVKSHKTDQYFERATLFGVYDFLERFAGIRFYFAGKYGTVIPKGKILLPSNIDIYDRPDFEIRRLNMETGFYGEKNNYKAIDKNSYSFAGQRHSDKNLSGYRLKIQTLLQPNSHGLTKLDLAKRFGKSHPEYFALLKNGTRDTNSKRSHNANHLCFSSNVKNEVYLDAKAYLSGKPASSRNITSWNPHGQCSQIFDLQPQDGFVFCACDKCKDVMSTPAKASDKVWEFTFDIADKLIKEKVPGLLQVMSYFPYTKLPKRPLPNNVLVQVAVNGPWTFPHEKQQFEQVKAWKEKNQGKVMLWNYCGKWNLGKHHNIPHWTPKKIGEYYKNISPYIKGAYLLCDGDYYLFSALNMYVFSKVAWDNNCDVNQLMDEFYTLMFGPSKKEMAQFFNMLEDLWLKANGRLIETVTGPLIASASQYEIFEKYYTPNKLKTMQQLFAIAAKKASKNPEVLERIKFMKWNFLDRIQEVSNQYFKHNSSLQSFIFNGYFEKDSKTVNFDKANTLYLQRKDGKALTSSTQVKAVLSNNFLHIKVIAQENEPNKVDVSKDTKKFPLWNQDNIELFLNPSCDRKNYYQIIINSLGSYSISKGTITGIRKTLKAATIPNFTCQVKSIKDAKEYIITIPLKSLNLNNQKLVCNFTRTQSKNNQKIYYTWSPFVTRNNHDLDKYGIINFNSKEDKNLILDGNFTNKNTKNGSFGLWRCGKINQEQKVSYNYNTFVSGNRSIEITRTKLAQSFISISTNVTLKKNQRYLLSYYIKLTDVKSLGKNGGVNVGLWTKKNYWFPASRLTGSTPWIKQSGEFILKESDSNNCRLNLFMYQASGTVNFDNIKIEEIK